jgi:thiamine kinase-like enzyme
MVSYETSRKNELDSALKSFFGSRPSKLFNPITVLASPAWRGVEGDIWCAESDKSSFIFKHYHEDTYFYVDKSAAILAAKEGGSLKVAPEVAMSWLESGIVVFESLKETWGAGGLHHILNEKVRRNIIYQKKTFQAGATLKKTVSIFDEIDKLYEIVKKERIFTHNDIEVFVEFAEEAGAKLRACGWDIVPCHRDGNTSNLMVNEDDAVMIIDFDLSANCDPFEDVGAYLAECFDNDLDARQGFEEWNGDFNEALFQRSMLYGLADDLRWGLIGSILGARSKRKTLEFSKYAAWRFLRLEAQVKRSCANDRIRIAG